ncbi:hypothetical protein M409DRAFT_30727 [Zasmidium cellare ATCC 36951]|uniref:MADS-box domain-containing protein n=1 Tax=Zasmidium cellare ATCC 36951 TaxID=1080233 RepID=A0A6A6BZ12_ZASCE|nr:uncharacterized protein M409DRAFT_30727 [Zasmidium cellare ATCC 36951]KAF2158769.1 hypothetical protein M409DRAFT_30727 [Zasmidium cellare ATCC 36951]
MARRPPSSLRKDVFRKRSRTVEKKADEIAKLSGAQVYVVMLHHGQFYVYTSHNTNAWPPSKDQIDQSFPVPKRTAPTNFKVAKD